MTEVPKIVHDRLRGATLDQGSPTQNTAEPTHPDADLLAAFAEQSLPARERDSVLEHLALCGDCRDTVALALPAETVGALPTSPESDAIHAPTPDSAEPTPRRIFAWPSLRWAALAAGVAVVGSVLLLRPGKLNQPNQPSASQQIASTSAPSSAAGAPRLVSPPPGSSSSYDHPKVSASPDEANLAAETPQSKEAPRRKFVGRRTLTPAQAESPMVLARNKKSSQQNDKLANMPGMLALDDSISGETGRSATQTTEVSAASSELTPASPGATSMARSDAPAIEKAKPALQGTMQGNGLPASGVNQLQGTIAEPAPRLQARASSAAKLSISASQTSAAGFAQHDFAQHNFAWTISGGVLRRSQDSGQTWQDSLHTDRLLLCYASHDDEIWTGGNGGMLYHSTDGGGTWVQVHPSANSRQLTADVSRIDLRSSSISSNNLKRNDTRTPTEIVVSTSNKESWTSVDGGKTWQTN